MIPSTVARVPEHTSDSANEEIRRRTHENITRAAAGGHEAIDRRLEELDREWDIERLLEANASTLSLIGLGLGRFVDRRFYLLPAVVVRPFTAMAARRARARAERRMRNAIAGVARTHIVAPVEEVLRSYDDARDALAAAA